METAQIKAQPSCWRARQDGLVERSLNRFNFSGICKRYLDSNGYSLRGGGQDLGTRFRFRLKPFGASLRLEALDHQQRAPLLVGQAPLPARRDHNRLVALQLEPGWAVERRVYQGRQLDHLYLAHHDPVNRLLALASNAPLRLQVIPYRRGGPPVTVPVKRATRQGLTKDSPPLI